MQFGNVMCNVQVTYLEIKYSEFLYKATPVLTFYGRLAGETVCQSN